MMDIEFMALLDSLPNINDLEDAALVLSSFLKCRRNRINPKSPLLNTDACRSLLTQDADLHALLKTAYENKEFSNIDKHVPRIPQVGWESYNVLQKVVDILRTLDELERVVQGEELFEVWRAPRAESTIAAHIEGLGIPQFKTYYPCTVMHQLGSFVADPSVKARLSNIFSSLHHTFLVNASGTGKTRLLLEGLCINWGFYFTSVVDSSGLGSDDVNSVIHYHIPRARGFNKVPFTASNSEEAININLRVTHRRFSETLLSRLLIFKSFLECATPGRLSYEHKKRWLLVQLRPDVLGVKDVFDSIQSCLAESDVADDVIENAIVQTLQEISFIWDTDEHFYVVLDEANHAAGSLSVAFSEEGIQYSVLKEIIRSWRHHLEHLPISFIVAGTDVPRRYFRTRSTEWDKFIWCSDTGAFDNEAGQRNYIQTFLPPEMLSSVEGDALKERIWRWFRGRYRLTAAFMTILLQNDFRNVHSHLNEQVYTATKYLPDDGAEHSGTGRTGFTDYHGVSLDVLRHGNKLRTMMHEALVHAICHFDGSRNLGPQGYRLVSQSQAHFVDADMSYAVVDEPILLIPTAKWFMEDSKSITDLEYFNSAINPNECRDIHRIDYVALYLARAFDGKRLLSDVLRFPNFPTWAKKPARLIVWKRLSEKVPARYTGDPPHQLVIGTDDPSGVLEWINVNEHEVPFCSLISGSNATLIFALELGRGSRVWVVLQAPSEDADSVDVEAIVKSLGMEAIFNPEEATSATELDKVIQAFKALPKLQSALGPHGVLGVVASLKSKVDLMSPAISDTNEQPIALVNIDLMERLCKERSQQALLDHLIFSIKSVGKRKHVPAGEEPADEAKPAPAKRSRKEKRKGAADTEEHSASAASGSGSHATVEQRYNFRSSTINKRRATS